MAPRDRQSQLIRRATVLALAGVTVRALWNFLPVYPGSGGTGGFGPVINFDTPVLIWGATVVVLVGVIALAAAAIRLLRRTPHSRAIASGILFALAGLVLINTIGPLMYSIEYVHQVGDFYDIDASGPMWVGATVGLVSVTAFAFAGIFALAADRTTPTDPPAMPSPPVPGPPPDSR